MKVLDGRVASLTPLFLSESFRNVAVFLLSFFSSIYIFKKAGFLPVFVFFIAQDLTRIIGTSLAENLSQRQGLKRQVFFGHVFTLLAILSFIVSGINFNFIWLAAAFWGFSIGFFWFGRYGLLTKGGEVGKYGEAVGWAGIINAGLLLGVPLLGGLLISRFGYPVLFLVSLVFVFLALSALGRVKDQKTHRDVTFREIFRLFISHKRMSLAYFGIGAIGSFYSVGLILYTFLFLKKELLFGGFFSLSMILVALVNFVIGRWVDRRGKKSLVVYGTVFGILVWVGRFVSQSAAGLLIFDIIDRLTGGMLGIPMEVLSYEKALDGQSTGRALLFRETALTLGSIVATASLMAIILLGIPLRYSFLLAVPVAVLPALIVPILKHEIH